MKNFWQKLPRPIFALAPMEEVTDFAFREMFARYSGEQVTSDKLQVTRQNNFVMFTEFINVDGLTHPEGRKNLAIDLKYSENQRPIVAQIWGNNPAKFEDAAKIVADLGFDGIDINMGCPQDKEIGIGACAALIREPKLAQDIIGATQKGGESAGRRIPVSVKTRLGYSSTEEMEEWIKHLLQMNIAALTLHARTKQEKSKVPAHWEKIAEAVQIRDEFYKSVIASPNASEGAAILHQKKIASSPDKALAPRNDNYTLIIGNGDIKSRQEGLDRISQTNCDGVMIGRGAFGNPWFFRDVVCPFMGLNSTADKSANYIDVKNRLQVMLEHAELFNRELGQVKSFYIMRKHFKAYCSGFPGAHELRAKLMEAKDLEETKEIIEEYLQN